MYPHETGDGRNGRGVKKGGREAEARREDVMEGGRRSGEGRGRVSRGAECLGVEI